MNNDLNKKWIKVEQMVFRKFGEKLDQQSILFIIGLQELGNIQQEFKKEEYRSLYCFNALWIL